MERNYDSVEVQLLRTYIDSQIRYLKTIDKSKFLWKYQKLQADIMMLQHDILPPLQRKTNIQHHEVSNYVARGIDKASELKMNGLIIHLPLSDDWEINPTVGVLNTRQLFEYGKIGAVEVGIVNMERDGILYIPTNINLDLLL